MSIYPNFVKPQHVNSQIHCIFWFYIWNCICYSHCRIEKKPCMFFLYEHNKISNELAYMCRIRHYMYLESWWITIHLFHKQFGIESLQKINKFGSIILLLKSTRERWVRLENYRCAFSWPLLSTLHVLFPAPVPFHSFTYFFLSSSAPLFYIIIYKLIQYTVDVNASHPIGLNFYVIFLRDNG